MPDPALLPIFLREWLGKRSLPREPEPALVMDDPEQVAAYALAGRIDGVMAASYLFHTARISQTIHGCATVIDLGCGPATQLAQVAELNPEMRFLGVDLSPGMLQDAARHVSSLGLRNVEFRQGDITDLSVVPSGSVDGVISTVALHHLPTLSHLDRCFSEIRRILRPGGAIYVADFGRLKSLKSVLHFAYMNAKHQPHIFSLDYERSLRAAFSKDDFDSVVATHFPEGVVVESTFKVPFLVLVKTRDRLLPQSTQQRLKAMQRALRPRYRRDLNDLRMFFAWGGLRDDPFSEQFRSGRGH